MRTHPARHSRCPWRGAIAAVAVWAALCCAADAAEFAFGAFGDLPYTREEEQRFPDLIAEMNREALAFVVHVGDFKSAWSACTDELFLERRGWFDLSHHPLVYVPGDNEWTDCTRPLAGAREPLERLAKLREIFFREARSLGQRALALARQSELSRATRDYPEHARWEHGGVLFVTLNAPGPDNHARRMPEEHARRLAASLRWLEEAFRLARSRDLRAVVVMMHANPWSLATGRPRRGFAELIAALAGLVRDFPGEVLLVHGDTHRYRVDRPLRAPGGEPLANFTRVEVFGSPEMNWVRIRVREQGGRITFAVSPGS
ncbi:MAG TPA: hypothetical protein VNK67_15420 [Burkholderiales bacterium]|nr:hypothetical protein [Burkholderiales bacterium]